jgi:hypothetical protein
VDTTIKLWEVSTGELLVTLLATKDNEWIAYTPDGYYNCSADGNRFVGWRVGMNVYSFDQYEDIYHKPEIIRKRIMFQKVELPVGPSYQQIPPKAKILEPKDYFETVDNSIKLKILAEDDKEVKYVDVFVNNRLITEKETTKRGIKEETITNDKKQKIFNIPVTLLEPENNITVIAYDSDGLKSDPVKIFIKYTAGKEIVGDLYLISIGISKYKKPEQNLGFEENDARSIVKLFSTQEGKLYKNVYSYLLVNEKATVSEIKNVFTEIKNKVRTEDTVILFLAGHGIKDENDDYYFVTYEGDFKNPKDTCLNWQDLLNNLREMGAEIMFLIDTCHAAAIKNKVISEEKIASNEVLGKKLREKLNAVGFVACKDNESSAESLEWGSDLWGKGHGAFAYAFLEGCYGKADYEKDDVITVAELSVFLPSTVRKLVSKFNHIQTPRLIALETGEVPTERKISYVVK